MKSCPHCQFLVADGAETCSVCHRDVTPQPVAAGAVAFAAPGSGAPGPVGAAGPPPFVPASDPALRPAQAPTGVAGRPAGSRPRWGLVAVIVAATLLVGMAGVAALFVVGTTVEPAPLRSGDVELTADELDWSVYRDPEGRFSAEMPGVPSVTTESMPAGFGTDVAFEVVAVDDPTFRAMVGLYVGMAEPGATFDEGAFSTSAAERMVEAGGFVDAEVVEQRLVEGSGSTAMEFEVAGRVGGEPAVIFSRLVLVGTDMYEINVAGPEAHREELVRIHDRLLAGFTAPAGS